MFIKKKLLKEENGSAVLLFAFAFIVILGIAGLVIDAGALYDTRSHLKKTANLAALSGVQELTNNSSAVKDVVDKILQANGDKDSLKQIAVKPNNQNRVRVVLEKDVPTTFMKLFKINDVKVTAASAADILPMSRARGAVPLGIDDSIQLEYLKEYSLKVASGDSTSGNFGILALSGTGASLYEQDLLYGYNSELKTGDIISTQTGNVDGKTRNSINSRISSCPYAEDDYSHRDCPRIVLVSVYTPYNVQSNQVKQVKITGFAYFYIKSPMGSNDTSIDGYFIQRAGSGYGDVTISDKGAYAIRLTE